jgi:RNA polymerase sigma-70 factor, ECF subfamily
MTPSTVVEVNRAVAVAMAWDAQAGLQMLLRLDSQADGYYPYHAARADLLRRTNQREAADASERSRCSATAPSARIFSGGVTRCSISQCSGKTCALTL